MSGLTRDGTAEPVSRNQILRHKRGQGNFHFSCSADHVQDWQPYPVDHTLAICVTIHTYCTILFYCDNNNEPWWRRLSKIQFLDVWTSRLAESMDQPGKVANPTRGQLKREENEHFPVPVRAS